MSRRRTGAIALGVGAATAVVLSLVGAKTPVVIGSSAALGIAGGVAAAIGSRLTLSALKKTPGIEIKSAREIEIMRMAGKIVATVLTEINDLVQPGMTTLDLDKYAENRICAMGGVPAFKEFDNYPASTCISINNEVVHGIPNSRVIIKDGDLVKIDIGVCLNGYHCKSCISICVGSAGEKAMNLSNVTQKALYAALLKIKPGNTLLDIAGAIEDVALENGFKVVEDYCGSGVGRNLFEEPIVFNFRTDDLPNIVLREGMTLAIYPIVNFGSNRCRTLRDGFTVVTQDGGLSAAWEHVIVIVDGGIEILTDRGDTKDAMDDYAKTLNIKA